MKNTNLKEKAGKGFCVLLIVILVTCYSKLEPRMSIFLQSKGTHSTCCRMVSKVFLVSLSFGLCVDS